MFIQGYTIIKTFENIKLKHIKILSHYTGAGLHPHSMLRLQFIVILVDMKLKCL